MKNVLKKLSVCLAVAHARRSGCMKGRGPSKTVDSIPGTVVLF